MDQLLCSDCTVGHTFRWFKGLLLLQLREATARLYFLLTSELHSENVLGEEPGRVLVSSFPGWSLSAGCIACNDMGLCQKSPPPGKKTKTIKAHNVVVCFPFHGHKGYL